MKLLNVLFSRIKRLFTKKHSKFGSESETHWVNHIYDESKIYPSGHVQWVNVHGFDEGPGAVYWVGFDSRYMGIRIADYVIKCKNKSTYDEYVNAYVEDVLQKMLNDSCLSVLSGDDVETEFIFRWGDEDKSFNIRLSGDRLAVEK